jgi:hypothetical protein
VDSNISFNEAIHQTPTFVASPCFAICSLISLCFAIEKKMKELESRLDGSRWMDGIFRQTIIAYLLNLLGAFGGFFIALGPLLGPPVGLCISDDLVGSSMRSESGIIERPGELAKILKTL